MHCEVFKLCDVARNERNTLFSCGDMTCICSSTLLPFAKPSTTVPESTADGPIVLLSRTVVNKMALYLTAGCVRFQLGTAADSCSLALPVIFSVFISSFWVCFFPLRGCLHFSASHESLSAATAGVCFSHCVSQVEPGTTVKVATVQPRPPVEFAMKV